MPLNLNLEQRLLKFCSPFRSGVHGAQVGSFLPPLLRLLRQRRRRRRAPLPQPAALLQAAGELRASALDLQTRTGPLTAASVCRSTTGSFSRNLQRRPRTKNPPVERSERKENVFLSTRQQTGGLKIDYRYKCLFGLISVGK